MERKIIVIKEKLAFEIEISQRGAKGQDSLSMQEFPRVPFPQNLSVS